MGTLRRSKQRIDASLLARPAGSLSNFKESSKRACSQAISTPPPPTDEVSKILTLRKKDQSADTKHPSEISPYPSEISQRSKDADRINPQKRLLSHPSEKLIRRGGVWTLNGMALN
jgi:hypothetical protein